MKWRLMPDKWDGAGLARYWWSDGSKTDEKVASRVDAFARLKVIQDNWGVKRAD
jgi:hypothetical protein